MKSRNLILIIVVAFILILGGCGCNSYNSMNGLRQQTSEAWSNVENQYKRRSDLIPNFVAAVRGAANFEQETLIKTVEARYKDLGKVQVDPNNLTPETIQKFQQAQDGLSSALSRLMVVVERYPELKAVQGFENLQVELSNTENKIATERSRFNEVVRNYNTKITNFPNVMYAGMLGFKEKGYFHATEQEQQTPDVNEMLNK